MQNTRVLTYQNVVLQLESSIVLWRILAFIIDFLIIAGYVYLIFQLPNTNNGSSNGYIVQIFLGLPIYTYTLLSEFFFNGRTIGKMIAGIQVVKIDGLSCGFTEYLLRWLFRIIDIYPFIFLSFFFGQFGLIGASFIGVPAFFTMLLSQNNQRLGDMVAGTTVVKIKNKASLSSTIFKDISEGYKPYFPEVVKLSDNDMRIIKETLAKSLSAQDYETIHKLRERVQEIMNVQSKFTDIEFLNTVTNDFNYYTQDL